MYTPSSHFAILSEFLQPFATATHSLRQSNCLTTHTLASGSKSTASLRKKDDQQHLWDEADTNAMLETLRETDIMKSLENQKINKKVKLQQRAQLLLLLLLWW